MGITGVVLLVIFVAIIFFTIGHMVGHRHITLHTLNESLHRKRATQMDDDHKQLSGTYRRDTSGFRSPNNDQDSNDSSQV